LSVIVLLEHESFKFGSQEVYLMPEVTSGFYLFLYL